MMNPPNQKDWMIEVIIEDESRYQKTPPFRQLVQFQKGKGIARGKYRFSRVGKPAEKGGLIKLVLGDRPEVLTIVRVLAPFKIRLKTKLARFRPDHLEQIGRHRGNFSALHELWVRPSEEIQNRDEPK